jgi:predicted transcriptional regulator
VRSGAKRVGSLKQQFVPIIYPMAKSDAWRSLSGSAVKVYVELHTRFNGGNNGELSLSLDEAARLLRIGKATAQRAFAELEEKGFVRMTKRGTWYGRRATTYRLTSKPHGPNNPTNEWKRWKRQNSLKQHRKSGDASVPEWIDSCINEPALAPSKISIGPTENP